MRFPVKDIANREMYVSIRWKGMEYAASRQRWGSSLSSVTIPNLRYHCHCHGSVLDVHMACIGMPHLTHVWVEVEEGRSREQRVDMGTHPAADMLKSRRIKYCAQTIPEC